MGKPVVRRKVRLLRLAKIAAKSRLEKLGRDASRVPRRSSWGHVTSPSFLGPRAVGGFEAPTPDPPKVAGKNARRRARSMGDADDAATMGNRLAKRRACGGVEQNRLRSPVREDGRPTPLTTPPARVGAPTRAPKRTTHRGEKGVFLSWRQYRRLVDARRKTEGENRQLHSKLAQARGNSKPPKCDYIAFSSLMQAEGVPARRVQHVLAVCLFFALGHVPKKLLLSASSSLRYMRISGAAFKQRLKQEIGQSAPFPFFLGCDTSNRAGTLESIVVSYSKGGTPVHQLLGFDRIDGSTAVIMANSLEKVVSEICAVGGVFGGISTDGTNSMTGWKGGLGVELGIRLNKAIRHDTCEFHASARLIACLESLWPAVMNVPSVTQLVYVTWYLLNDDWQLYHGRLVNILQSNTAKVGSVLQQFDGDVKTAIACLTKPLRPNTMRWNTLSEIIKFTSIYFEALQLAFDEERVNAGSNARNGSMAAICSQWLKWSGSVKLRSLLLLAQDFVENIWEPADSQIDLRDLDYNVESCFKVYSRPRRVVELLLKLSKLIANPTTMTSFQSVIDAFGDDRRGEVIKLYKHLFQVAEASVHRNSGQYLSGIYLFSGLGDPLFASFVFEAFSCWRKLPGAPAIRTEAGQLLEKELRIVYGDNGEHLEDGLLKLLLVRANWEKVRNLVQLLGRDKRLFVSAVLNASPEDFVLFTLRSWLPALSHTRPVEKTFLDFDQVSRAEGNSKTKAGESSGHAPAADLRDARVVVASAMHEAQRKLLERTRPDKKKKRVEAKEDVVAAVAAEFDAVRLSEQEILAARAVVQEQQDYVQRPRGGVSSEIAAVLEALLKDVEGWRAPQLDRDQLLMLGADLEIPLLTTCSSRCLKLERESKKGSPGAILSCTACLRSFHLQCMVEEGLMPKGTQKGDKSRAEFCCGPCRESIVAEQQEDNANIAAHLSTQQEGMQPRRKLTTARKKKQK